MPFFGPHLPSRVVTARRIPQRASATSMSSRMVRSFPWRWNVLCSFSSSWITMSPGSLPGSWSPCGEFHPLVSWQKGLQLFFNTFFWDNMFLQRRVEHRKADWFTPNWIQWRKKYGRNLCHLALIHFNLNWVWTSKVYFSHGKQDIMWCRKRKLIGAATKWIRGRGGCVYGVLHVDLYAWPGAFLVGLSTQI